MFHTGLIEMGKLVCVRRSLRVCVSECVYVCVFGGGGGS